MELEEELTDASEVTGNSSKPVPGKDLLGSTENNKDPLVNDTAEGGTGPPPEVTPTEVPDSTKNNNPDNTKHDNTGNGMGNESNQESLEVVSDSFKPPEIHLVVNSPATDTVPTDDSPKILRTPRRSTPSPKNEDLNDESFIDGMSEKLKEIQLRANLINSPRQKTILIEN